MNLDPPQDMSPDVMAAEYVIGTLDPMEREQAKALIASDPAFAAQVSQWERRLGELHALAGEIDPPPAVWNAIKAGLPPRMLSAAAPAEDNVVDLRAQLARWRTISTVAGSLAAVLALFIVTAAIAPTLLPESLRPRQRVIVPMAAAPSSPPGRFVAVLQKDATTPAFILTVDIANRSLTVRRVAAESEPGKSYELWLVSNRFPAPRSLGVVNSGDFTQSSTLSSYDPAIISDATFAVSLEPEGGSPSGAPSNVMFLGKLVETTPPSPRSEAH